MCTIVSVQMKGDSKYSSLWLKQRREGTHLTKVNKYMLGLETINSYFQLQYPQPLPFFLAPIKTSVILVSFFNLKFEREFGDFFSNFSIARKDRIAAWKPTKLS